MKKGFMLLAALFAAMAVLGAGCGQKQQAEQIETAESADTDADTIRIGAEFAYVPYNWEEDAESEYNVPIENHEGFFGDGYDMQIAKKIAENMGKKPVFVKISWDGLMQALDAGQIDMIVSGMLDSPEHKQAADFSETYAVSGTEYTVLVNKKSPYAGARSIQELKGASLLGQKGTRLDTVIDQIEGVNHVSPVDTIPAMLDRLVKGTVDGIVINRETVDVYTAQYPELMGLSFDEGKGFALDFSGICVGIKKGNAELLGQVNGALDKISTEDRRKMFDEAQERAAKYQ